MRKYFSMQLGACTTMPRMVFYIVRCETETGKVLVKMERTFCDEDNFDFDESLEFVEFSHVGQSIPVFKSNKIVSDVI